MPAGERLRLLVLHLRLAPPFCEIEEAEAEAEGETEEEAKGDAERDEEGE